MTEGYGYEHRAINFDDLHEMVAKYETPETDLVILVTNQLR